MKFNSTIAFIIINLAASVTAVALPQTQVGGKGGKPPVTQTQVATVTRTAAIGDATAAIEMPQHEIVEPQAGESGFTIINARTEAASEALATTLLKVARKNKPSVVVPIGARQTEAPVINLQSGDSVIYTAASVQTDAPLEARKGGDSVIYTGRSVQTDAPLEARKGGDSVIYTGRSVQTEAPVLARQGGDSVIYTAGSVQTEAPIAG